MRIAQIAAVAALLAAVGVGAFTDLGAATRATLRRGALEHPARGAHATYQPHYERFRASFAASRPTRADAARQSS